MFACALLSSTNQQQTKLPFACAYANELKSSTTNTTRSLAKKTMHKQSNHLELDTRRKCFCCAPSDNKNHCVARCIWSKALEILTMLMLLLTTTTTTKSVLTSPCQQQYNISGCQWASFNLSSRSCQGRHKANKQISMLNQVGCQSKPKHITGIVVITIIIAILCQICGSSVCLLCSASLHQPTNNKSLSVLRNSVLANVLFESTNDALIISPEFAQQQLPLPSLNERLPEFKSQNSTQSPKISERQKVFSEIFSKQLQMSQQLAKGLAKRIELSLESRAGVSFVAWLVEQNAKLALNQKHKHNYKQTHKQTPRHFQANNNKIYLNLANSSGSCCLACLSPEVALSAAMQCEANAAILEELKRVTEDIAALVGQLLQHKLALSLPTAAVAMSVSETTKISTNSSQDDAALRFFKYLLWAKRTKLALVNKTTLNNYMPQTLLGISLVDHEHDNSNSNSNNNNNDDNYAPNSGSGEHIATLATPSRGKQLVVVEPESGLSWSSLLLTDDTCQDTNTLNEQKQQNKLAKGLCLGAFAVTPATKQQQQQQQQAKRLKVYFDYKLGKWLASYSAPIVVWQQHPPADLLPISQKQQQPVGKYISRGVAFASLQLKFGLARDNLLLSLCSDKRQDQHSPPTHFQLATKDEQTTSGPTKHINNTNSYSKPNPNIARDQDSRLCWRVAGSKFKPNNYHTASYKCKCNQANDAINQLSNHKHLLTTRRLATKLLASLKLEHAPSHLITQTTTNKRSKIRDEETFVRLFVFDEQQKHYNFVDGNKLELDNILCKLLHPTNTTTRPQIEPKISHKARLCIAQLERFECAKQTSNKRKRHLATSTSFDLTPQNASLGLSLDEELAEELATAALLNVNVVNNNTIVTNATNYQDKHKSLGEMGLNLSKTFVLIAQLFGIACTASLIATLFRLRTSRIVVASSFVMLLTMATGAMLLYVDVLMRFEPSALTCVLEPWCRELGFCMFFGAILIKLYKILNEFQTRKAHRVCFSDRDLLGYQVAIIIVVIGYMAAWTALVADGFKSTLPMASIFAGLVEFVNKDLPNNNTLPDHSTIHLFALSSNHKEHLRCKHMLWNYVTELNEMILLTFGVHLVYKLRNASTNVYKEKLVLSASIVFEMLVSGSLYLFHFLNQKHLSSQTLLVLYCLRCQLTVSIILVAVFAPKLWLIGKSKPILLIRGLTSFGGNSQASATTALAEPNLVSTNTHLNRPIKCQSNPIHQQNSTNSANTNTNTNTNTDDDSLVARDDSTAPHLATSNLMTTFDENDEQPQTLGKQLPANSNNKKITTLSGVLSLTRRNANKQQQQHNTQTSRHVAKRHRCDLACELHEHHLNDVARLQQAIYASAPLDFGAISLAEMDPAEVQAELKRAYTQIEVLKNELMRKDNPHISKRRGGKKPAHHRKFSLQVFHNKLGACSSTGSGPTSAGCLAATAHATAALATATTTTPTSAAVRQQHQSSLVNMTQHYNQRNASSSNDTTTTTATGSDRRTSRLSLVDNLLLVGGKLRHNKASAASRQSIATCAEEADEKLQQLTSSSSSSVAGPAINKVVL